MSATTISTTDPAKASLDELRQWIGAALRSNPNAGRLWDILVCLRGPDTPSESSGMSPSAASAAYAARRKRKFEGVEVVRANAFFGACGGSARRHAGDTVVVNEDEDHHDRHLRAAAHALGLTVRVR